MCTYRQSHRQFESRNVVELEGSRQIETIAREVYGKQDACRANAVGGLSGMRLLVVNAFHHAP